MPKPSVDEMLVERCPTGIPGFDKLCNGGLVRNNTYVVLGGPGAGKTIFLLQYLWTGLAYNENGLYISFESDLTDVMQDAYILGWDFSKYDQAGKCKFIRLDPSITDKELTKQIMSFVAKYDVKRVCIDPLSVFNMTINDPARIRRILYDLCSLLKRLKVTVLLSLETPGDGEGDLSSSEEVHNIVEFLTDGVIKLHSLGVGGEADRAIRIIKMRRTAHVREPVPMKITNKGIVVLS
ncbi:MAG: ATPase domain-containing protein [Candidatus Pacearchaeota archaeon]